MFSRHIDSLGPDRRNELKDYFKTEHGIGINIIPDQQVAAQVYDKVTWDVAEWSHVINAVLDGIELHKSWEYREKRCDRCGQVGDHGYRDSSTGRKICDTCNSRERGI